MKIKLDDKRILYTGRIDWSDEEKPVFVFPCTSLAFRFTGDVLKICVENHNAYWDNYLGCILDGKQFTLLLETEGKTEVSIEVNRELSQETLQEHEFLLFKRQDACHEVKILEIEIAEDGKLLNPPQRPKRRIEVYGDSVSAGEVSEAVRYVGKEDPEHNGEYSNSWYSYAWMTARKLNAEIHDIAQGGIPLLDGSGWFCDSELIGMESVWDKVHYNPALGEPTLWEFEKYIPQVVIVAIGQNDSNPEDYMQYDPEGWKAMEWKNRYERFLRGLRVKYPQAYIVCMTTLLSHDAAWDMAINEVVERMQDEKISHYLFRRNGCGTPGHLRIPEAEEMAEELVVYLKGLHIEEWEYN